MNFLDYLTIKKKEIDAYIHEYLKHKKKLRTQNLSFFEYVINQIDDFSVRGKGIRGVLTMLASEMFGYTDKEKALKTACALELIHSSLLIHDDIADNDLLRRGNASIFAQYVPFINKDQIKTPFFAQSMAICVGNIAMLLGFELINSIQNTALSQTITQEIQITNIAQMNDIYIGAISSIPKKDDILKVYLNKTARYTFSLPLRVGALLAQTDTNMQSKLQKLGEHIGMAYQLQDDNFGYISSTEQAGKNNNSDIINNKKTLIRIIIDQVTSRDEKKIISSIFGNKVIDTNKKKYIKSIYEKYKINQHIQHKIRYFIKEGNYIIDSLPINKLHKKMLIQLGSYLTNRLS